MLTNNFFLLQTDESPHRGQSGGVSCEGTERGKNLCHCVHNSQTKLLQNWEVYMRIYWRL